MYKLIVTDFDGTLVDDEESVPLSTVLTIDAVRRQGVKIVVVTGRIQQSVLDYNRDFHFIDYLISSNGASIYDVVKKKSIYSKKIAKNILEKIEKKFQDQVIYYCTDDAWNEYRYGKIGDIGFKDWISEHKDFVRKIEVHFDNKKEALLGMKKLEKMNLKIHYNLQTLDKHIYLIEITSKDINKYTALKKLLKVMKISENEIIAIGDSYNDFVLLSNIKNSVAVDNAIPELKKIVKYQTTSNNQLGVEKIIEKLWYDQS